MKPVPEQSDSQLIEAVLAGGGLAFETLIERYQERIFRLLSRFTRDRGEVEDLGQEVFVKVFRKLHTFQQDSAFYTWVYRIAVNTAKDHFSRHSRRRLVLVEDAVELDSGLRDPDYAGSAEPLLEEELREVTRQVLETLPDKYREILILREYEDLSYTEMSQVLGCSMGTVESRLFRARQRFKEALGRMHPELVPQVREVRP
ncbi:MAG: sigma-70 family RNA polymerase sigma factor [Planctomycetota bacterium]